MANVMLTAEAVKALARRIKTLSPHLKHTEIIEEIAQALGWKGDALMHALKAKTDTEDKEDKEATGFVEFQKWVEDRITVTGEQEQSEFIDDELVRIWFRVNSYIVAKSVKEKEVTEQRDRWVVRDGKLANKLPEDIEEQVTKDVAWLKKKLKTLGPIDESRVEMYLGHKRDCTLQRDESVTRDSIVCLFDGTKKKMLKRYIWARYGLTAEGYRELFQLPEEYPMVAIGFMAEKRFIAKGIED